ncbi:hypothetical protein DMI69_11910 [Escherichia coli]|nr:hypothetical protein [Escherichia coli]
MPIVDLKVVKCGVSGASQPPAALALRAVAAVFPASNPGIVPCRCLSARLFSHHIITEGNSERRQRFTAPDLRRRPS